VVESSVTQHSVSLTNLTPGTTTYYVVDSVDANSNSASSAEGSFTTYLAPSISQQPASVTVDQGDNALFSVTASGIPDVSYQWKKDGNEIQGATSSSLGLTGIMPSDAGDYSVVVANSEGSVTSSIATLTVNPKYLLTVQSGTGSGSYLAGTVVNIAADSPPEGQAFNAWTGDVGGVTSTSSATTTLTMPSADISVSATYAYTGDIVSNLEAHWQLNETSGTDVGDSTANSYDTSLSNFGGAPWVTGNVDGALEFDGVDDYVRLDSGAFLTSQITVQTVALWFKADSVIGKQTIYEEGGTGNGIGLRINNGYLETRIVSGSTAYDLASVAVDQNWTHVAVSYDGAANATLFLDGYEVDTLTSPPPLIYSHGDAAHLGRSSTSDVWGESGNYFTGILDDVRIYSRALDEDDFIRLHSLGASASAGPDSTEPVISDIQASGITTTAADITWITDEISDSRVRYGTSSGTYTSDSGIVESGISLHWVNLDGLIADTTYFFVVESTDSFSNTATSSEQTFATISGFNGPSDFAFRWTFNNTLEEFTNAADGTFRTGNAAYATGIENEAVVLDGVDDAVDLGNIDLDPVANEVTLSAWFKADSFDKNDGRVLSKATGISENSHLWMLSTIKSGPNYYVRARLRTGSNTSTYIPASGQIFTGTWYHVALTYGDSLVKMYLNGNLVGSWTKSGTLGTDNTVGVSIGNQPDGAGDRAFDGLIDDVRIYDRALTASEISELATP
jgi:hypothetical protein